MNDKNDTLRNFKLWNKSNIFIFRKRNNEIIITFLSEGKIEDVEKIKFISTMKKYIIRAGYTVFIDYYKTHSFSESVYNNSLLMTNHL